MRLGDYDTSNDTEIPAHEDFGAERVITHENYRGEQAYDIAVIQLDRPVSFKSHIIPICLPESGDSFQYQEALVSGWGMTSNAFRPHWGKLQSLRVTVIPDALCAGMWPRYASAIVTIETILCAGAYTPTEYISGTCKGDSGGPLVVTRNGRDVLIGLATGTGQECEMPELGLFANVSTFMRWIRANTDRNEEDDY